MKKHYLFLSFALALFILTGCNKDDDDDNGQQYVGSFKLDGSDYSIYTENAQPTGTFQVFHDQGEGMSNGTFTIAGVSATHTVTLQFSIEYVTAEGVGAVYKNGDFNSGNHLYEPWLCTYMKTDLSGTAFVTGNEPDGTLEITKNSEGNYTIEFDFIYSDSTKASGNVTQTYTVQQMNIK